MLYDWITIFNSHETVHVFVVSFFNFLEDIRSFCGAIGTPVLYFLCHFLWVSKPEWHIPLYCVTC